MNVRLGYRSITGRLLLAFLAVFVPFVVLSHLSLREQSRVWRDMTNRSRASVARSAAAMVDQAFDEATRELQRAHWSMERRGSSGNRKSALESLSRQGGSCVAAGFLEIDSGKMERYPPLGTSEFDDALPPPDQWSISAVSPIRKLGGRQVFTVSIPVETPEGKAAVMYTVLTADAVAHRLSTAIGDYHHAVVVDQRGGIACQIGRLPRVFRTSSLLSVAQPGEGQVADIDDITGVPAAMAVIPLSGWRIAVFDADDMPTPSSAGIRWMMWSIIVTLASFLVVMVLGKRIAAPIKKLSRAAAAVAVGDLRRRVRINTGDELQSLAESFNQMAANLEEHERELRLRASAQQCLLDVTRTVTASLDIKEVATAIAEALKQQFGATQVHIFSVDEPTGNIEPVHSGGVDGEAAPGSIVDLAIHALGSPRPLSAPAPVSYPGVDAEGGTVVAIPLVTGSMRVGVLVATFPEDEDSSVDLGGRMSVLETFATYAAVAVQNAHIHSRTEQFSHTLASLRRVVEAVSSSLDLNQVLRSLVKITSEVTDAKACAIMLADRKGQLTVAESHNLSRSFRRRLCLQSGERWAGIAFAEKRPIIRADVALEDDLRLAGPLAKEGLHGYMCAPLVLGDEAIGTINVWMDRPHKARPMEIHLLTSIASHAAAVIANAKLFGREYQIAETLQTTLMGSVPERFGRLVFGHKYLPALDEARVGGDLYDVFALPNGKVGLMVADVSGKGIEAAVHTAAIRYMGRAFAFQFPDSPAAAVAALNRALLAHSGPKALATMFYAVVDPRTGRMTYANAGHPPAIALTRSGRQQMLFYRTGMPIGYSDESDYGDRSIDLVSGDVLLLYTDGIIEARSDGRVLAIEGLQDIVFNHGKLGPMEMVEMICEDTHLFANGEMRDDVAIIAASIEPASEETTVRARV